LLVAILLMGVLLAWFFLAKVTLYENSRSLTISEEGRVIATFSPEGQRRLRQGQYVVLRLNTGPDQPALALPAMVYYLRSDTDQVELILLTNDVPPDLLSGKISGRAEVEVEYLTPAQLLVRATGKYLNEGDIPVSPQNGSQGGPPPTSTQPYQGGL
jgi:hypothetical protein